ncbi:MAG: hypothetical protein N3F06_04310, partial [Nitrososphaerales archaeon]|nr:hypothetical protein [Nitrososphaerales archaeon]
MGKGFVKFIPKSIFLALFLLLTSTLISTSTLPSTLAQSSGPYISEWRVEDPNRVDMTNKTLMAGGVYTV